MHGNSAISVYKATVQIQKRIPLIFPESFINFHPEAVFKIGVAIYSQLSIAKKR